MKKAYGFTIVELLVVIVVIAILAAVSVVAYSGVAAQARDSQRAQDLANIKRMLLLYDAEHEGVVSTTSTPRYNVNTAPQSGWDASVNEDWLAFLVEKYGRVPVDPINETGGEGLDPSLSGRGHHTYFYYCYSTPSPFVVIGYHRDGSARSADRVSTSFDVSACL